MLSKLPEWVATDRFDIEARAPLDTTKDQYRLMMQALLRERFGMKLHFEQREMQVLAMVLAKPGKPGPRLISHDLGQPCDETPKAETYPEECYDYEASGNKDRVVKYGSRATTMDLIANFIGSMAGASDEIGRRVVDQTGLTGLWDFTLTATMPAPAATPPQDASSAGPTILEALEEQLGIKLKPTRAVVPVLVVDHIERPSEN